ncbi:MAG: GyrI-like domain-containing protein [Povalibacter sp.]
MTPLAKALWYINSHYREELSLEDIAHCAGVSRFHLLRVFGNATGRSMMKYVRALRLCEAARRLAQGSEDILSVAIDSGYASHEAFTRAFREQFGVTPESVRKQRHVNNLPLLEQFTMSTLPAISLEPPRFQDGNVLLLAGLSERYTADQCGANIPAQWQKFGPHLGHVPGQLGSVAYGVCYNFDEAGNMDYLCGVEVTEFSDLPHDFAHLRITPQRYAVFFHAQHISAIRSTWHAIWNEWLPQSGYELADAPFFERYDERFDPRNGNGGVELWIPIHAKKA